MIFMKTIAQRIADELAVKPEQVAAAIALLDEGATVPFIARYRKEVTGGLDDTQLRTLEERMRYLRELDERREAILASIREQDKLTPELENAIQDADTKTRLEDLYLPYKPKRRTKAQIAREAGLAPLAFDLLANPTLNPEQTAVQYVAEDKGVKDVKEALDGARQILMEHFAENAELLGKLREYLWENALLVSKVVEEKKAEAAKFTDYFEYSEALKNTPSHRALALFRGRNEGLLRLTIQVPNEEDSSITHPCEVMIAQQFAVSNQQRAADAWLLDSVRWAWKFKVRLHLDSELFLHLRELAEQEAIKVFASNLHDLLLAPPAGQRATLGLDPGLRTGVKYAVVDTTGKLVSHGTIYPHAPKNDWQGAIKVLAAVIQKHHVELISIGNGTASRETDRLVMDLLKQHAEIKATKIVVSEAGASVYSASELAAQEFPDLDVSIRGAVSIARRLQDPLAELVKIDPKSIGVGQYQHDVNQTQLARTLDAIIEDCVNAVGVDVNTASVALLSHVSGLNQTLAKNIVSYRDEHGAFNNREKLKAVPRLGDKTFEQAAGFLRINQGDNPLDASAVHPEAYPLVERILTDCQKPIKVLLGDSQFLRSLDPRRFIDNQFGLPTVNDILKELEKPGRDPRPEFKAPTFKEGVESLNDLQADMVLEGVVTNVTDFGAFVDIGVHQDGLIHISALSKEYVKHPRDVVKTGDIVKVKVLEVDLTRKRVALTLNLNDNSRDVVRDTAAAPERKREPRPQQANTARPPRTEHDKNKTGAREGQAKRGDRNDKAAQAASKFADKGKPAQPLVGAFSEALSAALANAKKK